MERQLVYDKGRRSFDEDWLPHRGGSDFWEVQGVFHEIEMPRAAYTFRMSVRNVAAGLNSFQVVNIVLRDLLHGKSYGDRWNMHSVKGEREVLYVDENSFLFGERAQIMREGAALAFRMSDADFNLGLRLDRTRPEYWYDRQGLMYLTKKKNPRQAMYNCTLPHISCIGRLSMGEDSMRVEGRASFERFWGHFPIRYALVHWERFYLFFDNGDEFALTDFPYGKHRAGVFFPRDKQTPPFVTDDYTSVAIDYLEIDEWRFACGWQVSLPQYMNGASLYLAPLIKDQYRLPVARPALGIYDTSGRRLGFALAELFPGARNELDKIGMDIYYED